MDFLVSQMKPCLTSALLPCRACTWFTILCSVLPLHHWHPAAVTAGLLCLLDGQQSEGPVPLHIRALDDLGQEALGYQMFLHIDQWPETTQQAASVWLLGCGPPLQHTQATLWEAWCTAWPAAVVTSFPTSTSFVWPSCWPTAACGRNTTLPTCTAKTGRVTWLLHLTTCCLVYSKGPYRKSSEGWWRALGQGCWGGLLASPSRRLSVLFCNMERPQHLSWGLTPLPSHQQEGPVFSMQCPQVREDGLVTLSCPVCLLMSLFFLWLVAQSLHPPDSRCLILKWMPSILSSALPLSC